MNSPKLSLVRTELTSQIAKSTSLRLLDMSFFACWYITSLWERGFFSAQVSSFTRRMKPETWAAKIGCFHRLIYYSNKFNMFCSFLTLASSWSHESLLNFYTLCGVLSIQSVTLIIQLFWRGYLHGNKIAWWTIRDPIFYFFIVDVLALILFLIVFRRDLCTWACQSLCPDVMHDTHADLHGYLIYSILFQLLILWQCSWQKPQKNFHQTLVWSDFFITNFLSGLSTPLSSKSGNNVQIPPIIVNHNESRLNITSNNLNTSTTNLTSINTAVPTVLTTKPSRTHILDVMFGENNLDHGVSSSSNGSNSSISDITSTTPSLLTLSTHVQNHTTVSPSQNAVKHHFNKKILEYVIIPIGCLLVVLISYCVVSTI